MQPPPERHPWEHKRQLDMTDGATAQIRRERDRFVSFAFAGADLLFEVDQKGVIVLALGAVQAVSRKTAAELARQPLASLFVADARARLAAALDSTKARGRMRPIRTLLEGPDGPVPVRVGAVFGAGAFKVSLTLLPSAQDLPIDQRTGLLTTESFAGEVAKTLSAAGSDAKSTLTMVELAGLESAIARRPEERDDIYAAIGAIMLDNAEGGLAAQIGPDRFGMLRRTDRADTLDQLTKKAPKGVQLARQDIETAGTGFGPDDMRSALLFVVRRFAEDGLGGAPTTLAGGFQGMLTDTLGRIDALRSKLASGISVAYQPICGLADALVKHHEVLARLEGESSPQEQIAFAEQIGVVGELDLTVARLALDQLEQDCPTPLAVNVSAKSLASDVFVQTFLALTARHAKARKRLMVEITETAELKDLERAAKVLDAFKSVGHTLCIDDFGGGAASLSYLRALPVQYVKIDGLYVDSIAKSPIDKAIVRAIAQLCHDIDMTTVAERIETEAQARLLADLGVDLGQGWLYGKPAPAPVTQVDVAPQRKHVLAGKRKGFTSSWG